MQLVKKKMEVYLKKNFFKLFTIFIKPKKFLNISAQ